MPKTNCEAKPNGAGRDALLRQGPLHDDEPLVAVEQRILNLMGLSEGLTDDDHLDQFGRELDKLDREIRSSVPTTPAGIAVKIRHLWANARDDNGSDDLENLTTIHEALRLLESACGLGFPEPSDECRSA